MRKNFAGREDELGFTLHRRRSRRKPAVFVTDLDFADDLALMEQAQEVLIRLETEAESAGLYCHAKRTVFQTLNQEIAITIQAKE